MSSTSYHRVKWIVKAGGLGKTAIEQLNSTKILTVYSIELCDSSSSKWAVIFTSSPSSENFAFALYGQNTGNVKADIVVRSTTEEYWPSRPTLVRSNLWRWEMKKSDVAALLEKSPIVFDIVVNIQQKPPNKVPLLSSICAEKMIHNITVENVLKKFKHAVIHKAKGMEEKCVPIIMLYYEELKLSADWKNLRPFMWTKIMDLIFEASSETCATVLDVNSLEDELMEQTARFDRLVARLDEVLNE